MSQNGHLVIVSERGNHDKIRYDFGIHWHIDLDFATLVALQLPAVRALDKELQPLLEKPWVLALESVRGRTMIRSVHIDHHSRKQHLHILTHTRPIYSL